MIGVVVVVACWKDRSLCAKVGDRTNLSFHLGIVHDS